MDLKCPLGLFEDPLHPTPGLQEPPQSPAWRRWPEEEDSHLREETDAFARRILPDLSIDAWDRTDAVGGPRMDAFSHCVLCAKEGCFHEVDFFQGVS